MPVLFLFLGCALTPSPWKDIKAFAQIVFPTFIFVLAPFLSPPVTIFFNLFYPDHPRVPLVVRALMEMDFHLLPSPLSSFAQLLPLQNHVSAMGFQFVLLPVLPHGVLQSFPRILVFFPYYFLAG